MADPKGFLTQRERELPTRRPVPVRIMDWREVYEAQDPAQLRRQAGRCMDCGIPFCHEGCPLGNLIPEWNDLVWRDDWDEAIERLHATNNFPEFTGRLCPAPCEASCVLGINQPAVTIKQVEVSIADKAFDRRHGAPAAAGPAVGPHRRGRRLRARGPGRGAAAHPGRAHGRGVRACRQGRRPAAVRHPRVQDGEVGARPAAGADGGRGHPVPSGHRRRRHGRGRAVGPAAGRPLRRRRAGHRVDRGARPARPRPRAVRRACRRWSTCRRPTASRWGRSRCPASRW